MGDYSTFEEFLRQFTSGMESIGRELVSPQGLTSEEKRDLRCLDEKYPVEGGGGERAN